MPRRKMQEGGQTNEESLICRVVTSELVVVAEHETSRRGAKSIAIIGGAITRRGRKTRTPLWVIACPLLRFHLRALARFSLYAARNHFNEPLKG